MTTLDILVAEIFDCEKAFRSFCEGISFEGDHNLIAYSLNQWYDKETFYFVSRKELEKWLSSKVNENRKNCGFCEECETCAQILHIRMCLDDAYYIKPHKGTHFQPNRWKVYFSATHSLKNFKCEIARARKGTKINWHKWFFSF